jgi:hypothetical protein
LAAFTSVVTNASFGRPLFRLTSPFPGRPTSGLGVSFSGVFFSWLWLAGLVSLRPTGLPVLEAALREGRFFFWPPKVYGSLKEP